MPNLREVAEKVSKELLRKPYTGMPVYAPHLVEFGDELQKALTQEDLKIPEKLFDRLVGFLVWLQHEDPSRMLTFLPKLREAARSFQTEMQHLRGEEVTCYLCKPPLKLKMKDIPEHDKKIHHTHQEVPVG